MDIQGISKRLFPVCVKSGEKVAFCLPFSGRQTQFFHHIFSLPGKSLLEVPCKRYSPPYPRGPRRHRSLQCFGPPVPKPMSDQIAQSASDEFCTSHNMQTRISCSGRGSELALPVLAALSFAQIGATSSFLSLFLPWRLVG